MLLHHTILKAKIQEDVELTKVGLRLEFTASSTLQPGEHIYRLEYTNWSGGCWLMEEAMSNMPI